MEACEIRWPDEIWAGINKVVLKQVGELRIAQRVFPTAIVENNPNQIPNEVIDFADLSITEGDTKPLVEIYREFSVTVNQVAHESVQKTCSLLATMAAKELALAEDAYLFQLSDRTASRPGNIPVLSNSKLRVDNWKTKLDFGLLGEANSPTADDSDPEQLAAPIHVEPVNGGSAVYGENTFKAVTAGIAKLLAKAQAPPYALFLPTAVYADIFVPPSPLSLVTTADRIKPLVERGFHTNGLLPPDEGLLVAVAGDPVKLYMGQEACVEYVRKEGNKHIFRVVERVQYIVRDPRSLVLLKFLGQEDYQEDDKGGGHEE